MTTTVGQRIRTARMARGLTLQGVGTELGIDRSHVQAWEAGRRNPGSKHLAKLADVLGLQVTDLLTTTARLRLGTKRTYYAQQLS